MAHQAAVTQRAYTLRLRGEDPQDRSWRDALWATHEAVNKGAKAFGDWLLTLRGGLDHALADAKVEGGKGKPDRDPTDEERKGRRILLALSWLSVESEKGAPEEYLVPHDLDKQSGARSNWKTVDALREILKGRGLGESEIESWVQDCSASLTAAIRDDAVWVNRSKAFDDLCPRFRGLDRDYAAKTISFFFGNQGTYLALPNRDNDEDATTAVQSGDSSDFRERARQWVSTNFGTGTKSDNARICSALHTLATSNLMSFDGCSKADFLKHLATLLGRSEPNKEPEEVLRIAIGWTTGRPSAGLLAIKSLPDPVTANDIDTLQRKFADEKAKKEEKADLLRVPEWIRTFRETVERECGIPYVGKRDHIGEYSVMLDHAARRVSIVHSWIKRAEAERRRFDEDAKRMANVPEPAKNWLETFCLERSGASGARDQYRIRRRAVDGWEEVVAAWSKADCKTAEDRIAAARALQDDPEIQKFGDIQLFEALADDDALCVWHKDGDSAKAPDPQPLIDYVLASDAESKKGRFKVPAYRHPDALLHPVFCDFGKSRWDIKFDVHEARKSTARKKEGATQNSDPHALSMTLWTGSTFKSQKLRWQSKRLTHDLALGQGKQDHRAPEVARADRLGRAAAGVPASATVRIAGIFEQKDWNGRLQAPRARLNAIAARVARHGWDDKAKRMRARLRWLITFSARLQPSGPWVEYTATFPDDASAKPFVSRKGDYAVRHQGNDAREGHAKLVLSRLPGLRVLSVDLGHRYAAACAVWETLAKEVFEKERHDAEAKGAHVVLGPEGCKPEEAIYAHFVWPEKESNAATKKARQEGREKFHPVTVYRRIGPDELVDTSTGEVKEHPAPWARLDRQFLIKLQGEDHEARKASPAEVEAVQELERAVGREPPDQRSLRVDDLMSETVRTVRLALQRHGRRARIAFNLTASKRLLPGGREEVLTDEGRVGLLADTLADWYALFAGKGWNDEWARQQWETYVTPLLQGAALPQIPEDAEATPKARKKYRADLTENLKPAAESLAQNEPLRMKLHCLWATRWSKDDIALRKCLRWLRDWILPRGKKVKEKAGRAIRHVGGLSLTRIATIKSLYQVQKAFHMRPEPEDLRKNAPSKGDDALLDFGRSILDVMEHLREQRVKQLASRIVEAALGIGIERQVGKKTPKRPRQRLYWKDEKGNEHGDRRFAPCHAVVIENLTHYRPDETRTRRENRQLMSWSSSKVKKYLAEACQLNGLHLREVQAGYTSRQDSRTGAPGVRCQDVPVKEFMRSPFWRKQVAQAEKKQAGDKGDARERLLCDLNAEWKGKPEADWEKAGTVRVPLKGGEIFVSARPCSCCKHGKRGGAPGLQADLNAAANIGLKALTDPDWPGKWWYVPCDPTNFKPARDKVAGSAAICLDKPLKNAPAAQDTEGPRKKRDEAGARSRGVVYLWRDVSSRPISANDAWREFTPYWNDVQARVVNILQQLAKNQGVR